jgi:hypothetical protein
MYRNSLVTDLRSSNQLINGMQKSKFVYGGVLGTMGIPKGLKSYGCGGLVRGLNFRRISSNSNIIAESNTKACVSLKELRKVNKKDTKHINNKLIHIVSDPKVLILSYEIIKSKPGNTTPGSNPETLDGVDLNWFNKTSKSLLAGKFKFKPARRKNIPKNSGKKKDL